MSTLTFAERQTLEKALRMESGYVLDFTDRTFQEFVHDAVRVDINGGKYTFKGTSKANRLRAFWEVEEDTLTATLLRAFLRYGSDRTRIASEHHTAVQQVVHRLLGGRLVADADALVPNANDETFDLLARAVRESIDSGRVSEGLDRLHTFLTKYLRVLCERRGLTTDRDKPLHSLMGEYLKQLRAEGKIKSQMAERIAKSSISTLEAFNSVRNEQSLAHDNEILASHEGLYIFNHVASLVRLLEVLEELSPGQASISATAPLP